MPQNFRVPSGSQSGGNPKKKRRTSQNTATPVSNPNSDMGHPNMMGAVPGHGDTVYAANPFDDNPSQMGGMAPGPGMSPNSMGPNGSPGMGGGPGTPNNMIPPPNSMGMIKLIYCYEILLQS